MATTQVAGSHFDWHSLIPILEMAGNTTALLVPGGAAFLPLITSLEQGINPLLMAVGSGQKTSITQAVYAAYAAIIAVLNALKLSGKLDTATLAKVEEYITASENALTAYMAAANGFDPTVYTPVTPIA